MNSDLRLCSRGVPSENCLTEGFTLAGFEIDCAHSRDKHGGLKSFAFWVLRLCVLSRILPCPLLMDTAQTGQNRTLR